MDPIKVNQVWKRKSDGTEFAVTDVGKRVAALKLNGDPKAKDNIALLKSGLSEFLANHTLMTYPPSFPTDTI